jgi:tetratricopeptide (TPR) repeat protein
MNCNRVTDAGLAEAFLRGRLAEAECEEYERHLFERDQCTAELQALRLAREEFLATQLMSGEITVSPPTLRCRVRWGWAASAAVAASAVIGALMWPREARVSPPTMTAPATALPATPAPFPGPAPVEPAPPPPDWRAIADVRPSPYQAPVMRVGVDEAQRTFGEAMALYAKSEYARAIPGLEAAAAADPDDAGAPFFLGVSRQLTNDDRGGIEALRAAIARGDTPNSEEARRYLARAHLRAGDPDLAIAELRAVIQLPGDFETEASQLLEEIEEVR